MKKPLSIVSRFITLYWIAFFAISFGCNSGGPDLNVPEGYRVAYGLPLGTAIVARASSNGTDWTDLEFPADAAVPLQISGVGEASHENVGHTVFFRTNGDNKLNVRWGVGNGWPGEATSDLVTSTAPTAVYMGNKKYLVATRSIGGTTGIVELHTFDLDTETFGSTSLLPASADGNSSVSNRPSVMALDGNVVLAWRRHVGGVSTIRIAKGSWEPSSELVAFSEFYSLELPTSGGGVDFGGVESAPVLTHDYRKFFLAFNMNLSGSGLTGHKVLLFSSINGSDGSWTLETQHSVAIRPFLNIAANSTNGNILLATVDESSAGAMHLEAWLISTSDWSWTGVSTSGLFPNDPKNADFAVVAFGSDPR